VTFLQAEVEAGREGAKERLQKAQKRVAEVERVAVALEVLSDQALTAAEPLVTELVRLAERRPEGPRGQAAIALFRGQWALYDRAMLQLSYNEPAPTPETKLLKGAELAIRTASPPQAKTMLEEVRTEAPDMVGAQALLVLVQPDAPSAEAELKKLRAMRPDHPLAVLAGPQIEDAVRTGAAITAPKAR
jgi:hypothetical protein